MYAGYKRAEAISQNNILQVCLDKYYNIKIDMENIPKKDKAAEEMIFGTLSVGSDEDLGKAYQMTRDLIEDHCMVGFEYRHCYGKSEGLQCMQERVTADEIKRYYQKTQQIIAENRDLLEKIAEKLLDKRVLTREDISEIKNNIK